MFNCLTSQTGFLERFFLKFYRRHHELVSNFNVRYFLHQGLSEPKLYGDLVYKFKKIMVRTNFSDQFRKMIIRHKRIGYNLNVMRQPACFVTVDNFAALWWPRLYDGPDLWLFINVPEPKAHS